MLVLMLGPQALYLLSHHLSSPAYWIFKTTGIRISESNACELHLNNAVVWRVDINSGHMLKCLHSDMLRHVAVADVKKPFSKWEETSRSSLDILHERVLLNHLEKHFGLSGLVIWLLKSRYDHQQQFGNIISSHSCSPAVIWSHLLRCHGQSPGNRSCFHPSLYLTAACKNYKAVSLKTWILLSDCAWRSDRLFFCSQRLPSEWGIHPSFRQNWVFQTPNFLMLKPRMV